MEDPAAASADLELVRLSERTGVDGSVPGLRRLRRRDVVAVAEPAALSLTAVRADAAFGSAFFLASRYERRLVGP
ncbi:MAG TPA: hypothetical protein PK623_16440, partial [Microthrixaceae bacterium]|nr:hypothetical protein [Microthrixaceae bacterium]